MAATCTLDDCYEPISARGLCKAHYDHVYSLGKLGDYPLVSERPFVPVCVCPHPQPDGMGECRNCRMGYTPGLMECRDQWIAYLDSKGVKRGFVRTSTG